MDLFSYKMAVTTIPMVAIQAWVEEAEQVINSQASFDTFQSTEVEKIVGQFKDVLPRCISARYTPASPLARGFYIIISYLILLTKIY